MKIKKKPEEETAMDIAIKQWFELILETIERKKARSLQVKPYEDVLN